MVSEKSSFHHIPPPYLFCSRKTKLRFKHCDKWLRRWHLRYQLHFKANPKTKLFRACHGAD